MPLSQSNGDGDARFGDLLNPSSDVSKNWSINVAGILRSYLEELANINLKIKSNGTTVNFAEAALLIQGSTSIFGKKVEYLYSLANQLFLHLHNENKKSGGEKAESSRHRDSILFGRHGAEFSALDDITPARNLNLNESNAERNRLDEIPSVPLCMIPLDSNEKGNVMLYNTKGEDLGNKKDYQLNLCNMHSSGCLLLPTTPYNFSSEENVMECIFDSQSDYGEIDNNDFDSEEMSPPECEDIGNTLPTSSQEDTAEDCVPKSQEATLRSVASPSGLPPLDLGLEPIHEVSNTRRRSMRQIEKQKAIKEMEEKERREEVEIKNAWNVNGEQLPEFERGIQRKNVRKLPKKITKKKQVQAKASDGETKMVSTLDFCNKNFFGAETEGLKKIGIISHKLAINQAFEQLIIGRFKEQQEMLRTCRKRLRLERDSEFTEGPVEGNEDFGGDDMGVAALSDDEDGDSNDAGNDVNDEVNIDDIEMPPDHEEPVINRTSRVNVEDAASAEIVASAAETSFTYEELVRQHVELYMRDVAKFRQNTELSGKVSKWEDVIKPILDNENKRETFNIHVYGTRIIDKFENNNRKQTLPFDYVCEGKTKWEVCRLFLASLQLANNNNVEIQMSRKDNGMHDLELTLLSRKRHQEQLDQFGNSQGEH